MKMIPEGPNSKQYGDKRKIEKTGNNAIYNKNIARCNWSVYCETCRDH